MFDVDNSAPKRQHPSFIFKQSVVLELCRIVKIAVLLDETSFCTLVGLSLTAYCMVSESKFVTV